MTGFSRNRNIFFQLLVGGLAILIFFAVSSGIVYVYFLHKLDQANAQRSAAASIVLHLQEARQYEGEGNSPVVEQHRVSISQLNDAIDTLALSSSSDKQITADRLREAVKTYAATVEAVSQLYQREGNGGHGVEGQWRAVVDTIQDRTHDVGEGIAVYADRLIGAQRNYLLDHDEESVAAIHAATVGLARTGTSIPGLSALAKRSDSLFQTYLDLRKQVGETEQMGLQQQLLSAAKTVQTEANFALFDAIQESGAVRNELAVVMPLVFLADLALAAFFFWIFAGSISQAITTLSEGATAIGKGEFTKRVYLPFRNELGRLGEVFNRMAEDLAALMASVQQSGVQINSSAMEIAATARQQQATASEIASTTAKVGDTAHEISHRSQELANTMKQVAQGAERTAILAGSGQIGISRMEGTMRQISTASDSINTRLATLSEKARNINTVVTTIGKVADQTNLLSLNAAIDQLNQASRVLQTGVSRLTVGS